MAPFGVFGAPLDAESRPGSPGDSGLARRGHKKIQNIKIEFIVSTLKHIILNFKITQKYLKR